jgi:hypothetical protein
MKARTPFRFCRTWLGAFIGLIAIMALAGCGAAGSSAESGSGTIIGGVGIGGTGVVRASLLSTTAGTSALSGAIVFLDTNNNHLSDPDEPFAFTGQNGSYTLQADAAALAAYPLLLQAIAGATIDTTTGQPVPAGFVMQLAP